MRFWVLVGLFLQLLPQWVLSQNVLSVRSATAESGQMAYLEIEAVNNQPFVAFQFDLTYNNTIFTFDKSQSALTDRKDGHSLSLSEPATNIVRAIAYSGSQKSFKGSNGAIIRIAFLCSSQDFGNFLFSISNAILANSLSQNILTQTINGSLTLGKTLRVQLNQGWTWISVNIDSGTWDINDVMESIDPKPGDYIKNQTVSATFYDGYGWFGDLSVIDPTLMYKIKLGSTATLTIFGTPVASPDHPISIKQGWNWIGFLPQVPLSTQMALSTINPAVNDYIKNQTVSSMYYSGSGWYGELLQLKPGEGYLLKTDHDATLTYPIN
ncbi:MAG: hypothetical protein PHS48_02420 [Bacteroidales bacterium]|nr:hypothetical protein [Bacteroidales bacterium]